MKKLVLSLVLAGLITGCVSSKKNNGESITGGIVTETTGAGTVEKVDTTAMNFSAIGSDSGTIAGLATVQFDYDSTTLADAEKQKLAGNAKWMSDNLNAKLTVEGHCDQRGSTEYNLSLGERRANTIKQMLIKLGVNTDRLSTVSFGKEKPVSLGDSEGEMAQNRRANFVPSAK